MNSRAQSRRQVTRWYLEMRTREDLRRAAAPQPLPLLLRAELPLPSLNRFLYQTVGGPWHWTDRLAWSEARWREHVARAQLQTWLAYLQGTPAGYVELEAQGESDVEIAYFGLIPEFIGRGLGGWFLSEAIDRAFAMNAARVWVHTCSLDAPAALANYQARGMRIYQEETYRVDWPEQP